MSGHDDLSGPTGFFDHLDDPAPPTPARATLDSVMHRGRRLRARRHAIVGASSAAAVTVLVLGGLGLSRAITADRSHDKLVTPLSSTTPSPSLSAGGHKPGSGGNGPAVVGPRAGGHRPSSSPSPASPSPGPCDVPSESPSPAPPADAGGPLPEPTLPPLVPTPTATPCPSESPSESPSPSASPTESPSDSAEPTAAPS